MTNKPEELAREILDKLKRASYFINDEKYSHIAASLKIEATIEAEQLAQMVIDIGEYSLKNKFMQDAIAEAKQEQREKDAKIADSYDDGVGEGVDPAEIAKAIRG